MWWGFGWLKSCHPPFWLRWSLLPAPAPSQHGRISPPTNESPKCSLTKQAGGFKKCKAPLQILTKCCTACSAGSNEKLRLYFLYKKTPFKFQQAAPAAVMYVLYSHHLNTSTSSVQLWQDFTLLCLSLGQWRNWNHSRPGLIFPWAVELFYTSKGLVKGTCTCRLVLHMHRTCRAAGREANMQPMKHMKHVGTGWSHATLLCWKRRLT